MLTFLLKIKRCNFFISRKHYFSAAKLGIQWHANIYELDGNKRKKFSRNWKIILVFVSQKTWSAQIHRIMITLWKKSFLHEILSSQVNLWWTSNCAYNMKSLRPFWFQNIFKYTLFGQGTLGWATIYLLYLWSKRRRRMKSIFSHSKTWYILWNKIIVTTIKDNFPAYVISY